MYPSSFMSCSISFCVINSSQNEATNEQYWFIDCQDVKEFHFTAAQSKCCRVSVATSASRMLPGCLSPYARFMDSVQNIYRVCASGLTSHRPRSHALGTSILCPTHGTLRFEIQTCFLLADVIFFAVSLRSRLNFFWFLVSNCRFWCSECCSLKGVQRRFGGIHRLLLRGRKHTVTYKRLAWLIIVGSRFDDWIYWTSILQLQLIITVHTLNSITNLLTVVWISDRSLVSRILFLWISPPQSDSYVATDGQSASLSQNKAPIWGLRPDFYYYQTVAGLLMWGALSNKRTGVSFTIAPGPRQRRSFSGSHFTVSDSRLPFS
jgi:hypothetical protein